MNLTYYTNVKSTWDAIYRDCENAKKIIRFEQFILRDFNPGEVGERFVSLFIKKAQQGVKVKLFLDIFGSYSLAKSHFIKKLKDANVEIKFMQIEIFRVQNIIDWTPHRNHRKLSVIDDQTAYVGGVVFAEETADWDDFHVRINGANGMFRNAFERTWIDSLNKKSSRLQGMKNELGLSLMFNEHVNNVLYRKICSKIRKARREITIVTPYFSPDKKMRELMAKASKRGVDVKVLLPAKSDNVFAQMCHLSYVNFLKRNKIKILLYPKMNHAKIIKIDRWLTFGSSNFDRLSFFYNKELNIQTENPEVVKEIEQVAINKFIEASEIPNGIVLDKQYSPPVRYMRSLLGYILRPLV